MNILLVAINAKYIHSNLAVYSLKAAAGAYAKQVDLAEYTINHQQEEIFRLVYQKKPDLLFLSCYIWNRCEVLDLAENIHKVLPKTVIWAGGPEVSYDAPLFLKENPQFAGVMVGEGEKSFASLLAYYVDGKGSLEEIPGVVYRREKSSEGETAVSRNKMSAAMPGTEIRVTSPAVPMQTLDDLPFVYGQIDQFENRIIYYETSRGCPFSCSYCLSSIDKRVRFRSLEKVFLELTFFLENKVPQVKFVDRTFNCSHSHAMAIWKFIQEHDNGETNFHFEIAADLLNEEELELLSKMRPGLVQLEIGVQTINDQALEAIHRTAKFEKIADRVKRIAAHRNIHQHLDLIAGLPHEDFESFKTSFDAVYRLHPQELQLGFLKVLRGAEMHERAQEYGIVYRSAPPYEVLQTRWITCDELLRLKEVEEMLEVYYNSQQFGSTIEKLERCFERPFALYEALADYYKEQELEGKSYSRMQRFVILREFIQKLAGSDAQNLPAFGDQPMSEDHLQEFDQYLTLDLYLRENAKSRPQWAEDLSPYKDQVVQFYQEEARQHRYLKDYEGMNWKQLMRMTHLERFAGLDVSGCSNLSPISAGAADSRKTDREYWILFDYKNRDPLTGDAKTFRVQMEEAV